MRIEEHSRFRWLQVDAFNAALKIAIEHNGPQHYGPIQFGNQTRQQAVECFEKQRKRDEQLRKHCQNHGILLIEVRELGKRTSIEQFKVLIKEECRKAGFKVPTTFDETQLNLSVYTLKTRREEMWERVNKRAAEIGYIVKSESYPGANGHVSLICAGNHEYFPRVENFLRGATCRKCWLAERRTPVVTFHLGAQKTSIGRGEPRLFRSIEEAAKAIRVDPNSVRTIAKGRGRSCSGFGIKQITLEEFKAFERSSEKLLEFCKLHWPRADSIDSRQRPSRPLRKPIILSDGRFYFSRVDAAKALQINPRAISFAVCYGGKCCGMTARDASPAEFEAARIRAEKFYQDTKELNIIAAHRQVEETKHEGAKV